MASPYSKKFLILREMRGLTQEQVSSATGLARATICGYETGRRCPHLYDLQKLSKFYGVGLSFFEDWTEHSADEIIAKAKTVFASDEISKQEKELVFKEIMRLYLQLEDRD